MRIPSQAVDRLLWAKIFRVLKKNEAEDKTKLKMMTMTGQNAWQNARRSGPSYSEQTQNITDNTQ